MRVALVEDNAIFCFLFKKFLEDYPSADIQAQVFSNGKQAWDYFLANQHNPQALPQMMFLDINMPLMNGWQLLENLVSHNIDFIHHIPLYIVSSSSNPLDTALAQEYSCIKDYIIKPIDRQKVHDILDRHVSSKVDKIKK